MAGFILTADLSKDKALPAAARAAHAEGFDLQHTTEWDFLARRGSLPLSLLMGPFVAYCNFHVSVLDHPQGVQIVVQRNFPWWAGWSGVRGARRAAQKLADAIDAALEASGGKTLDRQEY
jgi:hypothetical protein